MKKLAIMLSLFGLAAALNACGGDDKKENLCDSNFVDGCEKGVYLKCERTATDKHGRIVEHATIEMHEVVYVCNDKDELVPDGYSCADGVLSKDGQPVDPVCGADDTLIACSGNEIVQGHQVCQGNAVLSCDADGLHKSECGSGLVCTDYERNDSLYASCIKSDDVTEGCPSGISAFGSCNSSDGSLVFCTRKDASKGKTIRLDCAAQNKACMLINDDYGYDCTATCKDGNDKPYTEHGQCDGNVLKYCHEGNYVELNCDDTAKSCQFDRYQYDCK